MADQRNGGIAWTHETWNPVRGCSRVSEGCRFCYAEVVAGRFSGPGQAYEGLARSTNSGARWTGKLRVVHEHLLDPLRWTRPRRVFVNSMSDLFHENISDTILHKIFSVMALSPKHTFQVLTKRPERMARWLDDNDFSPSMPGITPLSYLAGMNVKFPIGPNARIPWPLTNVWLGVSIEKRENLDRLEILKQVPASIRFVSFEPLLEDLGELDLTGIDWAIPGGESGPHARRCDLSWIRNIARQCEKYGTAVFVKQLGAFVTSSGTSRPGEHWPKRYAILDTENGFFRHTLDNKKGGDSREWPPDLRVRKYPRRLRRS